RRNADVAGERELEAPAEAVAVDRGDDGDVERLDVRGERRDPGGAIALAERPEAGDVGAGGERAVARAAKDDDARVAELLELRPQVVEHRRRDRVHGRVVEPDRLDHEPPQPCAWPFPTWLGVRPQDMSETGRFAVRGRLRRSFLR